MSGPVLNYTTQVATSKTIGEVQALLARHGASRIAVDYLDGHPTGLFAAALGIGAFIGTWVIRVGAAFGMEALLRAADRLSRASRHGRGWEW